MNKILKNGMVVLLSAYFLAGNYMPNKVSEQKVNNRQVKSVGMYNFLQNRDLHLINGLDETINEVMNKLVKDFGHDPYEVHLLLSNKAIDFDLYAPKKSRLKLLKQKKKPNFDNSFGNLYLEYYQAKNLKLENLNLKSFVNKYKPELKKAEAELGV